MPREGYEVVRVNPSTNYRFLGEQILDYFGTSGDLGRVGRAWKSGSQPTTAQKRNAARELRAIRTSQGSMREMAQEIILGELTGTRSNPSKGTNVAKTKKKPAAKKRSGSKTSSKKQRDMNFVDGGFVSDHTGEIYKVVRSGDDKVAVKDFEGNGFTFDKTDLQKMKNPPLMPRTKVMVHGTPHTILTHRFVGIVSARDDNTGKWSQYPISAVHPIASGARSSRTATTIRENPIRTKEGRVLVARGTRAQAKKFFDMRKKMLAMGLTPPARIKIRGGWMTYESASWVFRHGPAGSSTKGSTKPRKRSETTARKPRKSSGGRSAPTDPISHMNRTLGLG